MKIKWFLVSECDGKRVILTQIVQAKENAPPNNSDNNRANSRTLIFIRFVVKVFLVCVSGAMLIMCLAIVISLQRSLNVVINFTIS